MKKITYDIESNIEKSHWWFVGRRRLLKFLLSCVDVRRDSPTLDVGCGIGSNLTFLSSMGLDVIGMDSEMYGLSYAKRGLSGVSLVNGDLTHLPFKPNSIGLIIATDILEHVDEDIIGINEIWGTLTQRGSVVFTVPAFGFLRGVQDVAGLHKRRYSKAELISKIESQGLEVVKSSYFNFFLFLPILLGRCIIRLWGLRIESENKINFPFINSILKGIFSLEPYLLRYFALPFGVSIFCIARKK